MRVTITNGSEWHRNITLQYALRYLHSETWRIKGMLHLNKSIEVNGWRVERVNIDEIKN